MSRLDPFPRFPAEKVQLERKLTDLFREVAQQVNSFSEGKIVANYNAKTAAPTTGVWNVGDVVRNTSPSTLGAAPNTYVIYGWLCTVAGEPGTWVALNLPISTFGGGGGGGTVTSVAQTVPAFLSVAGSPVTTSGTLAISYSGTALPVANGGTGSTSLTAYAPLFGGTTSTGAVQSGTVGTAGQVLTSNGAGALPTFQSSPVVASIFYPGAPTASVLMTTFSAPAGCGTITFAAAISGSSGKALTAATAQTDFDVRKNATTSANGTSVGTIRFAASGTVPSFIAASPFSLTGGSDWLTVWAPASPDATLADISASLYGTRVA